MLRLSSCLCAAALLAMWAPAHADAHSPGPQQSAPHQSGEWSAAKKQKRKQTVVVQPDYHPFFPFGWRAADPSFDQYGRPYQNPYPGQCMIDLGYGRWESCDQVGGR